MTEAEVLRLLPQKNVLREELLRKKDQLEALYKEVEMCTDQLTVLDAVTEVFAGKPLKVWQICDTMVEVSRVACGYGSPDDRRGRVYRNAHHDDETFWGIALINPPNLNNDYKTEEFFGAYWPDKDECIKMIKCWVALGVKPKKKMMNRPEVNVHA